MKSALARADVLRMRTEIEAMLARIEKEFTIETYHKVLEAILDGRVSVRPNA